MPMVAQFTADEPAPWDATVNFQGIGSSTAGVNYASPKLGTQSYAAGSLTTTRT
jgi:hypothetical protein